MVSAGIKAVIEESLAVLGAQKDIADLGSILTVCATDEKYDERGALAAFLPPLATLGNKDVLFTPERFPAIKGHHTALVLGDSSEDLLAIASIKLDSCLKVGFDNYAKKEEAEAMCENYDIVIRKDGSLDVVTELLGYLTDPKYVIQHVGLQKLIAGEKP